jgi:cytochrome c oxidase subunit 2
MSVRGLIPALLVMAAVLGGAGAAFADGPWLPENVSTIGEKVDHLYRVIFWLTAVLLFLTEGALLYFIFRYRARPGRRAMYFPDHPGLEIAWWVVPGLILVGLALYQWDAWADAKLRPPDSERALRVQILARQFEWHMRYAGPDGEFATADDVVMTNQLHIPTGTPVLAEVRAVDVIHSFFLPNFRVKQDILPGTTTLLWFDANKAGRYEIACAELCGLGHYRMRGQLFVDTPEEFDSWLQEKYAAGATAADDWGWDWEEGL